MAAAAAASSSSGANVCEENFEIDWRVCGQRDDGVPQPYPFD